MKQRLAVSLRCCDIRYNSSEEKWPIDSRAVLLENLYSPNIRGSSRPDGPFEVMLQSYFFWLLGGIESERAGMASALLVEIVT